MSFFILDYFETCCLVKNKNTHVVFQSVFTDFVNVYFINFGYFITSIYA